MSVPIWYDLLTKLLPPVLTGIFAFSGAYYAFTLANRGRKYDLLYKERYASFLELSGFLYALAEEFNYVSIKMLETRENESAMLKPDILSNHYDKIKNLVDQQPNFKYTAILKHDTRTHYIKIQRDVYRAISNIIEGSRSVILINNSSDEIDLSNRKEFYNTYMIYEDLSKELHKLGDKIYSDLKLPKE